MRPSFPLRSLFARLGALALLALVMCACAPSTLPPHLPALTAAPTLPPTADMQTQAPTARHVLVTSTSSPSPAIQPATLTPAPTDPGSGLIIEEHELLYAPGFDPLSFAPRSGTQGAILGKYAAIQQPPFEHRSELANGNYRFYPAVGDDHTFVQVLESGGKVVPGGKIPNVTLQVVRNATILFETSAGQATPATPVRGFWLDGEHWYLEIAYGNELSGVSAGQSMVTGQIYQDGAHLNDQLGSPEMFGFQFLGGKPFYFYQKDNRIHLGYDQQVLPVEYDAIPHYQCCSAAELNPRSGPNWIAFFGRRGKTWYYTEILKP